MSTRITTRETEVMKLIATGARNKEIAHSLGISEGTIKVHVGSIMKKLKAKNRTEIALRVIAGSGAAVS